MKSAPPLFQKYLIHRPTMYYMVYVFLQQIIWSQESLSLWYTYIVTPYKVQGGKKQQLSLFKWL